MVFKYLSYKKNGKVYKYIIIIKFLKYLFFNLLISFIYLFIICILQYFLNKSKNKYILGFYKNNIITNYLELLSNFIINSLNRYLLE